MEIVTPRRAEKYRTPRSPNDPDAPFHTALYQLFSVFEYDIPTYRVLLGFLNVTFTLENELKTRYGEGTSMAFFDLAMYADGHHGCDVFLDLLYEGFAVAYREGLYAATITTYNLTSLYPKCKHFTPGFKPTLHIISPFMFGIHLQSTDSQSSELRW